MDNLDGALALKDYSQERDAMHAHVALADQKFEQLLRQIATADGLKRYQRKMNIVAEFGDPHFCTWDGGSEKCLWRRIVGDAFDRRVYLYFDAEGLLQRWEDM